MLTHKTHHQKLITIIFWLVFIVVASISAYNLNTYRIEQFANIDAAFTKTLNNINLQSELSAKAARKKQPVYITLPGAKQIRATVADYSITSNIWTLVNKNNSIPISYVPDGLVIPSVTTQTNKSDSERSVRSDIETPLINMFTAASDAGYQLMISSGYRSAAVQKSILDNAINSVGLAAANQSIALPGQSEHQTGLATDISTVSRNCYFDTCFGDTSDGQWLVNNSYKYGFILRYPSGKESTTGYQYEPWHFRYVGIDLATALHDSGLTLDEAWPYLQTADDTLRTNDAI
ncbi:MAG: M15 family metallopeptidase [Candidatus Saccharibacteria bacterium]